MSINDQFITQINSVITSLKHKFTPDKTLMMAIAVQMRNSARKQIENQGADASIMYSVGSISTSFWPKKMFPGKALIKSGVLLKSIQASATDNTAIASTNRVGAALMHFGGEVKAKKKLGSVKRKKDVWAMEQYFWSQWYKSNKKQNLFKILALHMQKHNSINVPARPFMVLTENYVNNIIEIIRKHVVN